MEKRLEKVFEFASKNCANLVVGKADREKLRENRVGLGKREGTVVLASYVFLLCAIFCSLAFSLLSHFLRSSALTESLTQASLFLNHRGKIASTDHVQTRCGRLLLERSL